MRAKMPAALAALMVVAAVALLLSGCTDTLKGEKTPNQKPIVYFVNIPPEGQTFSRNPVVYWVGTDRDGQVASFRYHVATVAEFGGLTPEDYIAAVPAARWIRLDVVPTEANPRTTNIVKMSADLSDPVRTFVQQYVFLQAYDNEGLGSDIIYRLFGRNDNPPQTQIYGIALDSPFVNAATRGGIITGVKMKWLGTDPIDYPSDAPPFEFDWKLYGPYTQQEYLKLVDSFITKVYVTRDARLFRMGDTILRCDTSFVGDSTSVRCDTIVVSDTTTTTAFGGLEDYFRDTDTDFVNSGYAGFNRLAAHSGDSANTWIPEAADTIYDVFGKYRIWPGNPTGADSTIEMYFVFTVRSRDDARVADLTPAFKTFTVIDPRRERDVAVIDFTRGNPNSTRYINVDTAKAYFTRLMTIWKPTIDFDTKTITMEPGPYRRQAKDYILPVYLVGGIRLVELLKHKVLIVYHDDIRYPNFNEEADPIYTAIDAGINVWVMERGMLYTDWNQCQSFAVPVSSDYSWYFGVDRTVYSAYITHVLRNGGGCLNGRGNNADFVGTYSMDVSKWPDLRTDSALLFQRYYWVDPVDRNNLWYGPDPLKIAQHVPALPEVDWSWRGFGTEIMYLYRAADTTQNPMGQEFFFQGSPVGHRLNRGLFRTVHFNFTPLGLDPVGMDSLGRSVLDWLSASGQGAGQVAEGRYRDAPVPISLEDARANFVRRRMEKAMREGVDLEALGLR